MWEGPVHCGWFHVWAGGPGCCNQSRLSKPRKQTSKQPSSMASASVPLPGSCLGFLPSLLLMMERDRSVEATVNLFLPSALITAFITAIETPTRTPLKHKDLGCIPRDLCLSPCNPSTAKGRWDLGLTASWPSPDQRKTPLHK